MARGLRRHVPDTGGVVGRYVLGAQLGAGGMGVVYCGATPEGKSVAIKIPYREVLDDDYMARRFRDEGIAGSIVRHRNLGCVYEHGETESGIPFIVMEQVDGERIGARIARDGMLSLRRAATLVRQLLDGLDALHSAGIVHADVKSDNLLVTCDGDGREMAKLIDFGLAHPELECQRRVRPLDLVSGTPEYMAPEVARGEGSSPASDIYGAGIIFYELVTGAPPFTGGTGSEIARRHLTEPVIPPSLRRPDRNVPLIVDRIVLHALAKDPSKRFKSAAAFASALAVALPCLDDDMTGDAPAFSPDAPTLDWRPGSRNAALRSHVDHRDPAEVDSPPSSASRAIPRRTGASRRRARYA